MSPGSYSDSLDFHGVHVQSGHFGSCFFSSVTRSVSAEAFVEKIKVQCVEADGRVMGLFTGLLTGKNITPKSNNTELRGTQRHIDPQVHRACSKGQGGGEMGSQAYGCLLLLNIQV